MELTQNLLEKLKKIGNVCIESTNNVEVLQLQVKILSILVGNMEQK